MNYITRAKHMQVLLIGFIRENLKSLSLIRFEGVHCFNYMIAGLTCIMNNFIIHNSCRLKLCCKYKVFEFSLRFGA